MEIFISSTFLTQLLGVVDELKLCFQFGTSLSRASLTGCGGSV